jgi:hypothetical protein
MALCLGLAACGSDDPSYRLGVNVTGLLSGQSVTFLNGTDSLVVAGGTSQAYFARRVGQGGAYAVTVGTQPANESCALTGGSGSNVHSETLISVTCTPTVYTISGTVTGLGTGQSITVKNNDGDGQLVTGGGSGTDAFSFSVGVPFQQTYAVTYTTTTFVQCDVTNGSGTATANVTNVTLACHATFAAGVQGI